MYAGRTSARSHHAIDSVLDALADLVEGRRADEIGSLPHNAQTEQVDVRVDEARQHGLPEQVDAARLRELRQHRGIRADSHKKFVADRESWCRMKLHDRAAFRVSRRRTLAPACSSRPPRALGHGHFVVDGVHIAVVVDRYRARSGGRAGGAARPLGLESGI